MENAITLFALAAREKFRFVTSRGALTAEDLWDLDLTSATKVNLNDIAKDLFKQVKNNDDGLSFVTPVVSVDPTNEQKLELVKFIIGVKIAERDAANAARAKREQKARIMELLAKKQDDTLAGKSEDELRALLAAM